MSAVKESIRRILTHQRIAPVINRVIRSTRTQGLLPTHVLRRMPLPAIVRVRLPDGESLRLVCPGQGECVATALFWGGFAAFEPETTGLFYRLSRAAACVCDIGAYTGYYGLLAARASAASRVCCFEPVPALHRLLAENVRLNAVRNVTAEPLALGNQSGETEIHLPDGELPTSASLLAGFRPRTAPVRVAVTTLDEFVTRHTIPRVDLIKIDTEATEHQVLAGMREVLKRDAPVIVSEVLFDRNGRAQQAVVETCGYRWFHLTDAGPVPTPAVEGDPHHRCRNYLFVHPRRTDLITLLPRAVRDVLA